MDLYNNNNNNKQQQQQQQVYFKWNIACKACARN